VSLCVFWLGAAATIVSGIAGAVSHSQIVDASSTLVAFGALLLFEYTLFKVWEPDTAREKSRALWAPLRPGWSRPAMDATGWDYRVCLAALICSLGVLIVSSAMHGWA
jgi:hypothetical protein